MSGHFRELSDSNREALKTSLHVRWAYLEETLRLQIVQQLEGLMKLLGVSQTELAKRSRTTQPMVSRLLSGDDQRSPTLETLVKLADALNTELVVEFVERSPVQNFSWEPSQVPTPSQDSWGGAVVVGEAQAASAARRWHYQRPEAEAVFAVAV